MNEDRGHLLTEQRNERSRLIDTLSVADAFDVMATEDASVPAAVARARNAICKTVDLVTESFRAGGRLIYVGAGTSGRLGVLDASECPPTFLSDPHMVQGIIAGGWDAMRRSAEGAEDSADDGAFAIADKTVDFNDVVLGIASGGTTPFVHGALAQAKRDGAKTVFLACVPFEQAPDTADVSIRILTGPEIITGSTRLKAGTATKLALNMITTLSMISIGKVFGNLMTDLNTGAAAKLTDRAERILCEVTDLSRTDAVDLLKRAGGRVKTAIVMHFANLDHPGAEARLASNTGCIPDNIPRPK